MQSGEKMTVKDLKPLQKYDIAYRNPLYSEYSPGLNYARKVIKKVPFKTVLDVGCGPGAATVYFLLQGKIARGIEPCKYVLDVGARALVLNGIVKYGTIQALPVKDNAFNLVFCSDVLEHIVEKDVEQAISELIRVSNRYVAVGIALFEASFLNLGLHETVRPSKWWDEKFAKFKLKRISRVRLNYKFKPGEEGGMEAIYEKV